MTNEEFTNFLQSVGVLSDVQLIFYRSILSAVETQKEALTLSQAFIAGRGLYHDYMEAKRRNSEALALSQAFTAGSIFGSSKSSDEERGDKEKNE